MEGMIAELAKLGLAGLFIGYLMLTIKWQRDDLARKDAIITALQDKRVVESAQSVATLGAQADANEKVSEALTKVGSQLAVLTKCVETLAGMIMGMTGKRSR